MDSFLLVPGRLTDVKCSMTYLMSENEDSSEAGNSLSTTESFSQRPASML